MDVVSAQALASAMICAFCIKTIFGSGKTWDYHQRTFRDLEHSAFDDGGRNSRCVFCSRLFHDVQRITLPFGEALYRWSIHRPGRTREAKEAIIVAFRPVRSFRMSDRGSAPTFLPERIIYLFSKQDLGLVLTEQELGQSTKSDQS